MLLFLTHSHSIKAQCSLLALRYVVYNVMYMFITLMAYHYDCVIRDTIIMICHKSTCMTVHMHGLGMATHTFHCQIIRSTD